MLHNPNPDPVSQINDLRRIVDTLVLENKRQWYRFQDAVPPVLPDYMVVSGPPPSTSSTTTGTTGTTTAEPSCYLVTIPGFTLSTSDCFNCRGAFGSIEYDWDDLQEQMGLAESYSVPTTTFVSSGVPLLEPFPSLTLTLDPVEGQTADIKVLIQHLETVSGAIAARAVSIEAYIQSSNLGFGPVLLTAYYLPSDGTVYSLRTPYSQGETPPASVTVAPWNCDDPPPPPTTTGSTTGTTTGTTTSDCGWNSGVVAQQNWIATLTTVSGECRLVWTADPEVPANCGPGCEPNPPTTPPPYNPTTPNGDGASQATPCVPVGTAGPNDQYTLADWLETCPDSTTTGTTTAGESCNLAQSAGPGTNLTETLCWAATGTLTASADVSCVVNSTSTFATMYLVLYETSGVPYVTAQWWTNDNTFRLRADTGSGEADIATAVSISPTSGATYAITITMNASGSVTATMTGTGVSASLSGSVTPFTGVGTATAAAYDPADQLSSETVTDLCVTGDACAGTGSGTGGA